MIRDTPERRLLIAIRAHLARVRACPRCVAALDAYDDCHAAEWRAIEARLAAVLRDDAKVSAPS